MTTADRAALAFGWLLVLGLFAGLASVSLVLGIGFSPEVTALVLAAWGISTAETFVILEPLVIAISATMSHIMAGYLGTDQ